MNQRSIIMERPTGSAFLPGLYSAAGTVKNTDAAARNVVIDNLPVKSILYSVGFKHLTVDGSLPLAVYGNVANGTKAGSKKVTFQVPALSTLQYFIIASQTEVLPAVSINSDTTIIPTV